MRFPALIGPQEDYTEHLVITPQYHPCPQCGMKGKRKHTPTRSVRHVAMLYRRCWIVAKVGVYKARCECCLYFQAQIPGVPPRGRYSYEVRNTIANALMRDRMP
jgi:transposase